jgi:hypothetical protein
VGGSCTFRGIINNIYLYHSVLSILFARGCSNNFFSLYNYRINNNKDDNKLLSQVLGYNRSQHRYTRTAVMYQDAEGERNTFEN